MDIDWSTLEDAIEAAADDTDAALASKVSSLTRLTDAEVKELFPGPADVRKLKRLMEIVKSSASETDKINELVADVRDLGGAVIKLLTKFV